MQLKSQPLVFCLTISTAFFEVIVGPEGILVVSFWPFMRNLTLVPPTSTTRTFVEVEAGVDLVWVLSGMVMSAGKYISSSAEFGGRDKESVVFRGWREKL